MSTTTTTTAELYQAVSNSSNAWSELQKARGALNDFELTISRQCQDDPQYIPVQVFMATYVRLSEDVARAFARYAVAAGVVHRLRK